MRAYAFIESRRSILWPLWSGALALDISALTVLYLGASPVGSDPAARPITWARRFVRGRPS